MASTSPGAQSPSASLSLSSSSSSPPPPAPGASLAWWRSRAVQVVGPVALIVGGLLMLAATRLLGPPPKKHVRFTLPKKRRSRRKRRQQPQPQQQQQQRQQQQQQQQQKQQQQQQQQSPERRVSCLQAAWDHPDIQETYGSLDHVARLFREFSRIADGRDLTDVVWTRRNFARLMRTAGIEMLAGHDAGDLDDTGIGEADGGSGGGGGDGGGGGANVSDAVVDSAAAAAATTATAELALQAQSLFSAIDESGTGSISFTAFLRAFGCSMRGTREEQARFLLRLVDPRATGFVTLEGLQG